MSKGGQTQTQDVDQSTQMDPGSRRFIEDFLRPLGMAGAQTALGQEGSFFEGATDAQRQAMERLGQDLSGVGNFGFSPSQMDPNRAQAFFNPFQDEVVGGVQQDFDRQRQQALTNAAQEATGAGAFGGSRSGILQAQALGDVNRNESQTLANLRNRGFQNAQQMAAREHGLMQNLGFGSAEAAMQGRLAGAGLGLQQAGQQFGMGERMRQIAQQRRQEPLFRHRQALGFGNMGFGGPTGETTRGTTTTEQSGGGLFGNLLGAGLAATGLGLPGAIGGLLGIGGGGGGGGFDISQLLDQEILGGVGTGGGSMGQLPPGVMANAGFGG